MSFPVSVSLNDALKIEIHLHEFYLGDRQRTCWTYLTVGLVRHGQREMVLSLIVDEKSAVNDYPRTPIKMFQLLGEHAANGRMVDWGEATKLGESGIFGFPCLFYVPAIQFPDLPSLDDYLGLMLVHQLEYDYAKQYGLTRLLARLGKFCSSFPYPTWNTQVRPSLFTTSWREISILSDASHISLEHSQVHQANNTLQFQLHKDDLKAVIGATHSLTIDRLAIFNCTFSTRCDASLYWQEGQANAGAYAAPEISAVLIGGSFIAIGRAEASEINIVEDGYSVNFQENQWDLFQAAMRDRRSFECDLTQGMRFILDFVDVDATPRARQYKPHAVWLDLSHNPHSQAVARTQTSNALPQSGSTARLISAPFINLSGEKSLSERVDRAALDNYIVRINDNLTAAMVDETDAFSFTVELTLYPTRTVVTVKADIELNPYFSAFIESAINQISACPVTSQVKFRLPFRVNQAETST